MRRKKKTEPAKNVTQQMVEFSREKALTRKTWPKSQITGRWDRAVNRVCPPAPAEIRDRSLRGKDRIRARKAANKRYYRSPA